MEPSSTMLLKGKTHSKHMRTMDYHIQDSVQPVYFFQYIRTHVKMATSIDLAPLSGRRTPAAAHCRAYLEPYA